METIVLKIADGQRKKNKTAIEDRGNGKRKQTKMNKFRNKKIVYDGICFDSKKELSRFKELKLLESSGTIQNLQRQVKFILIPAQREPDTVGKRGGIVKGKVIEREVSYVADFVYKKDRRTVVEDVKSAITRKEPLFVVKRKLMLHVHGIRIKEI